MHWTAEQILSLATDYFVLEASRRLAFADNWRRIHVDTAAQRLWGECLAYSTGTAAYTQIDLRGPHFHCTCNSRQHPCKHALALFLLFVQQNGRFETAPPPTWVREWQPTPAPPNREPQQPADEEQRQARLLAGLEELERWLHDLVRHGLAHLRGQPATQWERIAARMVDAGAGSLARELRYLATLPNSKTQEEWPSQLLATMGRLQLLIEGFRHFDELAADQQADLRAAVGWLPHPFSLVSQPHWHDCWSIVGRQREQSGKLNIQRVWLIGQTHGRTALLQDYAYGDQLLDTTLVPGTQITADIAFYPSASPLLATIMRRHGAAEPLQQWPSHPSLNSALAHYGHHLAHNPWQGVQGYALANVRPLVNDTQWLIMDESHHTLPLVPRFANGWYLLALSSGHPLHLFGEWDGQQFAPLSALQNGRWHDLHIMRGIS